MTIHYDMSFADYIKLPGWNWSKIKLLANGSPLHVKHAVETEDDGDTTSRLALRAVHTMTLEPHNFDRDYPVFPGPYTKVTRNTKAYKEYVNDHDGKHVLLPEEIDSIKATAAAYHAHPEAAKLLSEGRPEVTVTWTDTLTGLPCKGRIDWLNPSALVDIKGIGTANPRRVGGIVAKNLYHGQMAHYREGLEQNGITGLDAFIIAGEGSAPFDVGVFDLGAGIIGSAIHAGNMLRRELMATLAECVESNRWPGCAPKVEDLTLPAWAYADEGGE